MLSLLGRLIRSPWFWSLIGVIVLCAMIWFLLGAIGFGGVYPFEEPLYRLAAILAVVVIYFVFVFVSLLRSQRANRRMVGELDDAGAAAVSSEDEEMTAQEVATLRERMREAMGLLRKAKFGRGFGRRYLYQLPWYMLIGPPGSGKTTALVKSGLRFVLADKLGTEAVRGVGGTRNCDWWFTDEAVLIDTAGRYTTQDTRSAVDTGGWQAFLDLLRRNRSRQPINGVFIVIAINEVMAMDEQSRAEHAKIIRTRINELHERLRQRFPLYVLLTKCDLVAGFVEFFDELGGEERQQVWGMTFALGDDRNVDGTASGFGREFDLLVQRLNQRLIDRMHRELDIERRALVYGFPAQMASLRDLMQEFLDAVFRPSQFEERPMLRGVYFTSGTQEGTPIDRLMGALATRFGVSRSTLPAFSGGGRSYFLTRLLREVAFPEAYIASATSSRERRRIWIRRVGYVVIVLAFAAIAAAWGISFVGNQDLIAAVEQDVDGYNVALTGVEVASVEDTDFKQISGALDILRDLPVGYQAPVDEPPMDLTFGLYQGEKLNTAAIASYTRGLNKLLAPRLFLHLEGKIRDSLGSEDALYNYLRVYLMLDNTDEMDQALVKSVLADDWEALYPGDENAPLRANLAGHLDTLITAPDYDFTLDSGLVQQARQALTSIPLEGEAYEAIKGSDPARNLPTWRVIDHIGPQGDRVMIRRSDGTPLTAGVAGLYTYRGFTEVFLPALDAIANRVASQRWVLSESDTSADRTSALDRFRQGVTQSYLNDYVEEWDRLLNDVTIRPMETLDEARSVLNILASPGSPLQVFLTDAAQETTLARPQPVDPAASGTGGQPADGGADPTSPQTDGQSGTDANGGILGTNGQAPPAGPLPGQYVNDQFVDLHTLVNGADGQPPALDGLISDFRDLYRGLNAVQTSDGAIPEALTEALQKINAASADIPDPVAGVVAEIMAAAATVGAGGASNQIRESYLSSVRDLCEQAVLDRYPFEGTSDNAISLGAFAAVFGKGGVLNAFYEQNLAVHVDETQQPWQWKPESLSLNLSTAALQQFERAEAIRVAFLGEADKPDVQFQLTPLATAGTVNRAILTIDGGTFVYENAPIGPEPVTWPGADGPPGARVEFTPRVDGQPNAVTYTGDWGWFRMLDASDTQPGPSSDIFSAIISAGARSVTYQVRANGLTNPFVMPELKEFRCPTTL